MRRSETVPAAWLGDPRSLRLAWLAATAVLVVIIGILTLAPTVALPHSHDHWDKLAHLAAFLALVLPTALLWPRAAVWVGVLAVAYGGAIELIQPYTGRSAELADLLADAVGVGLGLLVGARLRRMPLVRRMLGTA